MAAVGARPVERAVLTSPALRSAAAAVLPAGSTSATESVSAGLSAPETAVMSLSCDATDAGTDTAVRDTGASSDWIALLVAVTALTVTAAGAACTPS